MTEAQPNDKTYITTLLSRSFDDNKSVNYLIPQNHHRSQRILRLMEYSFDYCRLFRKVYLSDDRNGCALIVHPQKVKTNASSVLLDIKLILNCIGLVNLPKALKREAAIKKLHPREPFCYLWFIGVATTAQKKGTGTKLLKELLDQCDKDALPVYLETSVAKNLPWYENAGFTKYEELNWNYQLYCMKRGARLYND